MRETIHSENKEGVFRYRAIGAKESRIRTRYISLSFRAFNKTDLTESGKYKSAASSLTKIMNDKQVINSIL